MMKKPTKISTISVLFVCMWKDLSSSLSMRCIKLKINSSLWKLNSALIGKGNSLPYVTPVKIRRSLTKQIFCNKIGKRYSSQIFFLSKRFVVWLS